MTVQHTETQRRRRLHEAAALYRASFGAAPCLTWGGDHDAAVKRFLGLGKTKEQVVTFILSRCEENLSCDPPLAEAAVLAGLACQAWGAAHRPQAISAYQRAVDLLAHATPKPRGIDTSDLYIRLAKCLDGEHRFPEAESAYRRAIAVAPGYMPSYCGALKAMVHQNRLADAITWWNSLEGSKLLEPEVFHSPLEPEPIVNDGNGEIWRTHRDDLLQKQARGYVYHPRKSPAKPAAQRPERIIRIPTPLTFQVDLTPKVETPKAAGCTTTIMLLFVVAFIIFMAWWCGSPQH